MSLLGLGERVTSPGRKLFQLVGFDDLESLPDPSWLIEGLVPESGLSVLYGRPGAAKSFLALDWAMSVASGTPWLGREIERRWVVHIAAEGKAGLKSRARAWWDAHGRPEIGQWRLLPEAVNLRDRREIERLEVTLAELPERPGLLVIDTMARSIAGGDENAAKDVGEFIAAVDALRGENAALVVHHTGKDGDRERGSSALRAAADLLVKVERDGLRPAVTLKCEKLKDGAEWQPLGLRLEESGGSLVLARDVVAAEVSEDDSLRQEVLSFVGNNGPVTTRRVRDAIKAGNTRIDAELKALSADGLIDRRDDEGWRVCPTVPGTPGHAGHASPEASGGGVPAATALPVGEAGRGTPRALPAETVPANGNGRLATDEEADAYERAVAKFGEHGDAE